jgi:hypothetical protein
MPGMPALVPTKLEVKTTEPPPRINIGGGEIDVERMIPLRGRNLRQRLHGSHRTGIVDGDIEATEDAYGRIRQPGMGFGNTGIAGNRVDATAGFTNVCGNLIQGLFAARIDDNGRTFGGKQHRRRPADAG